jgi:cytochrome c5
MSLSRVLTAVLGAALLLMLGTLPSWTVEPQTESTAPKYTTSAQAAAEAGDPVRGKKVFRDVGRCNFCHGWAGDGTGSDPRHQGEAANLRITELDTESLIDIVRCGIPGSEMPYHDAGAYKDDRCYGMLAADFDPGTAPKKGNTFRLKDIENVVAYIEQHFKGIGPVTKAECEEFFDGSSRACDSVQE